MIEYVIGKNDENMRADRFLMKATTAPSSLIYKAIRKKDVKVNKKHVSGDYLLSEGDVLCIYIDESLKKQKEEADAALNAKIVFEDENIIIFDKPAGVFCQPDGRHSAPALSDMFKSYMKGCGLYDPGRENSFSPALCNRLDANTTGMVIGAKNAAALRDMNMLIREHCVKKYYKCTLEGIPKKDFDVVNAYITKDGKENKSVVKKNAGDKKISMEYRVLEKSNGGCICEVLLHTGRSHQIRAYFSSVGCPLKGDKKYGAGTGGGQKLRAYKIEFDFPKDYNGILAYLNGKIFTA